MTTPQQFIEAARKIDLAVDVVHNTKPDEPQGVNVWADPDDRYPTTTVWWSQKHGSQETNLIFWGDKFEHEAEPDEPADVLAARVKETLRG